MSLRRWFTACWPIAALAVLACGTDVVDGPNGPRVASVEVTSAVDTILALGRTSQLTAAARDASGNAVSGTQFTWDSNDDAVSVSVSGLARGEAVGRSTVTATAGGSGVGGTINLRVVDADLEGVAVLANDALGAALVGALSSAVQSAAEGAWDGCGSGAGSGNVVDITECVTSLRAQAALASNGTDRALLAVLGLYADQIERQLGL